MSFSCSCQILDQLFHKANEDRKAASEILLRIALSIFFMIRSSLLSCVDAGEVMVAINTYIQTLEKEEQKMIDLIMHSIVLEKQLIEKHISISSLRKLHRIQVASEIAALELKREEKKASRMILYEDDLSKVTTNSSRYSSSSSRYSNNSRNNNNSSTRLWHMKTKLKKAWKQRWKH